MKNSSFLRVYELDRLIQRGKLVSAEQAANKFEVSRRTIERDLDELRALGAELEYDRAKRCYQYKGKPVTLPAQWLNEKEFAIILIAEKALRIYAGLPFYDEIHPIFNKLLQPIRHDDTMMENIRQLCRGVAFHRPFAPERNISREFGRVLEAIMNKQAISFWYKPADGKLAEREINPYVLVNDGGDWYLVGHCKMRNSVRTFALDRIFNSRKADHYFAVPRDFKIEDYLEQGFGRMRGKEAVEVRLWVTGKAAAWVERNKWHPSQKMERKKDGLEITMKCPVTDSLMRWVLQMGGDVRILAPEELRRNVLDECGKMMALNNG